MKKLFFALFLTTLTVFGYSQEINNVKNALVIGVFNDPQERFSVEADLTAFFNRNQIKAIPSLNLVKQGGDIKQLLNDSIKGILTAKGIDTYVFVSVRGYDKRFKHTHQDKTMLDIMDANGILPVFQEDMVSVTFEFSFFRKEKFLGTELIRVNGIKGRPSVFAKMRKKLEKILVDWKSAS